MLFYWFKKIIKLQHTLPVYPHMFIYQTVSLDCVEPKF